MATVIEHKGCAVEKFLQDTYDVLMVNTNCFNCVVSPEDIRVQDNLPDLRAVDASTEQMNPKHKLGLYTVYRYSDSEEFPMAINLYGSYDPQDRINYAALTSSVLNACAFVLDGVDLKRVVRVCFPKPSRVDGDWEIIKEILEFAPDRIEWHVYEI